MPPFKHGTHEDEKGYLRVSAGKHRNTRVATMVAEGMLGRKLLPTEDVHHKDGDRKNPEWTNLEVIDHSLHGWVSAKQGQFMKRKEAAETEEWNAYFAPGTTTSESSLGCSHGSNNDASRNNGSLPSGNTGIAQK